MIYVCPGCGKEYREGVLRVAADHHQPPAGAGGVPVHHRPAATGAVGDTCDDVDPDPAP